MLRFTLAVILSLLSLPAHSGIIMAQPPSVPTGYFHVGRSAAGFADLVDTQGWPFFVAGVHGIRYTGDWTRPGPAPYAVATASKYGSWAAWSKSALGNLADGGFNTIGGSSDIQFNHAGHPYTWDLMMSTNHMPFPSVYSAAWRKDINAVAANMCAALAKDPSLIGYYTDNELNWSGVTIGPAREYFKQTTAAIRRYDHNHLILGCRFAGQCPDLVLQAMAPYVDVVSLNKYTTLCPTAVIDHMASVSGKPLLITEFSAAAKDSGLPNTVGIGPLYETQTQRAAGAAAYVTGLIADRNCVGYIWFKYSDEPAQGSYPGKENYDYGIVSNSDVPYSELIGAFAKVNAMPAR